MIGYGRIEHVMSALEAALSRSDYLAGDDFTAADLYVGSALGFGMMFGTIEKCPTFERYWQRLSIRPAYKRAKELDDALAPRPAAAG
jgi:glutathione S-transferase